MTKEIQAGIENWRIELESEIKSLKGEYDDYVRKIKITNAKISISSQAMNSVAFGKMGEFKEKFIIPLESEIDRLENSWIKRSRNIWMKKSSWLR